MAEPHGLTKRTLAIHSPFLGPGLDRQSPNGSSVTRPVRYDLDTTNRLLGTMCDSLDTYAVVRSPENLLSTGQIVPQSE